MDSAAAFNLIELRGLRSAPVLGPTQAGDLADQLAVAMGACDWFTVGIMAPSAAEAITALRSLEARLAWPALAEISRDGQLGEGLFVGSSRAGAVFLKGNQHTEAFVVRPEQGLGEGILITGHGARYPDCEDTWGPFPLNFFG